MSARKLMAAVFWDGIEALLVEFMQQVITVTSKVYCETLKKKTPCWAMQNKRGGMLMSGVELLHDNGRLHTAARTRALLEHLN
jgi:hypothetical protein